MTQSQLARGGRPVVGRSLWPIGLGAAYWSIGSTLDERQSIRTLHAALDAGVRLVDTSFAYTQVGSLCHNEYLIARALSERSLTPNGTLVVTKCGSTRIGDTKWKIDGRPERLREQCELSLKALGIDAIELYLLHWPDPQVPISDSIGAMLELQSAGKVRAIGVSNVSSDQLTDAQSVTTIAAVENNFSAFDQSDRLLVERCSREGISYLAYSPLGGADKSRSIADKLPVSALVAREAGVSPQQLLLAWLLRQSASIVPIAGATKPRSITDSAAAPDLYLGEAEWCLVDAEIDGQAMHK